MDTPFVVKAQNGTTFSVKQDGMTDVLRPEQPALELPTADLLEAARMIETPNVEVRGLRGFSRRSGGANC